MSRDRVPSRRALTGAALIAIAATGVLVAHRAAVVVPEVRHVVVTRELPAGHRLSAADLGTVAVDVPRGVNAVQEREASGLVGRVTRGPLDEMDLLRPGDLFEQGRFPGAGTVEVALELRPARALSGTVSAGDLVDVLATDREGVGTRTVARAARISAVQDVEDRGIGAAGEVQVRLGLPDAETAAAVVDASIRSEISLVLPVPDSTEAP